MTHERDHKPAADAAVPRRDSRPARGEEAANRLVGKPGDELPASVRQPMQARFDVDFANVRVHSDRAAAEAASALGSRAFTIGRHIAFNHGEYKPASPAGQRLLAHELAHVAQQRDADSGRATLRRDAHDEHEANTAADRAVKGLPAKVGGAPRAGSPHIQADDGKGAGAQDKADDKPAGQAPAGTRITFVMRAPDDAYTQDVTDYVQNTLGEKVVVVDNIQEAAEYAAKYAKDNKTKVGEIRIIGHGSTTGGIKMTPKGEADRRFVTAQELSDMAADQKVASIAKDAMAPGATVEFYGCYVGRSEETGKAVGTIFGGAQFKAIDSTLRTSNERFARRADKDEDGEEVNTRHGKERVVEVKSSQEIDDRVAKGDKALGKTFDKWLLDRARQMEADGDLPPQKDDAARIAAMREVFDRSGGKIKRLEIHTDKETLHKSDKRKWVRKWKTTKVN
ncbi:DUF4157 domain-containing protein [Diaphorobacter limosus]|uniref:DUF4157 domain-containing protein n=1 Tax=Diaphorobacter limosus TaxID=3036128 RepID=A0ABZ0J3X9_9BURK|nr:DUF4157 domain-containing protein [Diaphorobacter sp. Y-1]WOO32543.1 DUF4157 domain-containing protein [Diaphorobacter sp. Y-1]GAO26888.1 hypothetical protein ALISP_6708 [Alicycliphilus sp. B1]